MIKNLVKIVITAIIFSVIFYYIDFDTFFSTLKTAHMQFLIYAILFQLLSTYTAAYRWYLIMKNLVFNEKNSFYIKSYFKGMFFNQVLPSSIGGDAVRIIELSAKGYDKKDAFYGIFVDRVIGLVGLLVLNIIANFAFYGIFPIWFFQLINIISIIGIIGFIVMMNLDKFTFIKDLKFINLFYRLGLRLNDLYQKKSMLYTHIFISIIVHIFSVLTIYMIALSVDVNLPFYIYLVAIPPIFLLTIIPISLAGWGVREGAMVGVLMLVGAQNEKILAISIIYGIILILSSLPGAYFWNNTKKAL